MIKIGDTVIRKGFSELKGIVLDFCDDLPDKYDMLHPCAVVQWDHDKRQLEEIEISELEEITD